MLNPYPPGSPEAAVFDVGFRAGRLSFRFSVMAVFPDNTTRPVVRVLDVAAAAQAVSGFNLGQSPTAIFLVTFHDSAPAFDTYPDRPVPLPICL